MSFSADLKMGETFLIRETPRWGPPSLGKNWQETYAIKGHCEEALQLTHYNAL